MFIGVCAVKWSEICNIFVMNCTAPKCCNVIKIVTVTLKKGQILHNFNRVGHIRT